MMVATGRAEVMAGGIGSLWDSATMQPSVEEAGQCLPILRMSFERATVW
jgi:hypothetical protein